MGVRVGLSSGPATVGNMGSAERFDYSALGETVNAGARAEAACKHVDTDILIAGDVLGKTVELAVLPAEILSSRVSVGASHATPYSLSNGTRLSRPQQRRWPPFKLERREHMQLNQLMPPATGPYC